MAASILKIEMSIVTIWSVFHFWVTLMPIRHVHICFKIAYYALQQYSAYFAQVTVST